MSSKAFLTLSKLNDPREIINILDESYENEQLLQYLNSLKLIKSINLNELFHNYFELISEKSISDRFSIYSIIINAQFNHYINTNSLFELSKLYYNEKNFEKANEFVSQINLNKINPIEWQLNSIELNNLKFNIYKLIILVSNNLNNFNKFDEYLKKIYELLLINNSKEINDLHTFILLKLNKFQEVFKKLYNLKDFNELFYILLLFNINYINEINIDEKNFQKPILKIYLNLKNNRLIYYDNYINCLKYLLDNNVEVEDDINLTLTNDQILKNFKIVIFKHNLKCISKIYNNISILNLKKILKNDQDDLKYQLDDELFNKILYDSIISGKINAKIDDINQIIEFNEDDKDLINNDWNNHIIESCLLLDNIITEI